MSLCRLHRWKVSLPAVMVVCILASQPSASSADAKKVEAEFLAKAEGSMEQHSKAW